MKKILVVYYSKTGNTEKIAKLIAEGAKKVEDVDVQVAKVGEISPQMVADADGFAFGSPAYFSLMSGPLLDLLTELYLIRDKMMGKPMVAFATGAGSQTSTIENIENVLKALNPKLIQNGLAVGSPISSAEEKQAEQIGEDLAKKVVTINK